jgi:hypothetical protein
MYAGSSGGACRGTGPSPSAAAPASSSRPTRRGTFVPAFAADSSSATTSAAAQSPTMAATRAAGLEPVTGT